MSAPCPATRLDHPQDPVARERDRARGGPADWLRLAAAADLPTRHGRFRVVAFRDDRDGREHVALVRGDVAGRHDVPTRLHSECLTGDVMGSLRCDCRDQLEAALRDLGARDRGLLLYLRQEGRGIGLANKVRAYALQDAGLDTVDANLALGFREDERDYAVAAHMLAHLEVRSVRLMTNNPDKLEQLQRYGVRVSARIPHVAPANEHNRAYLRTKAARCGHRLELAGEGPELAAPRRGARAVTGHSVANSELIATAGGTPVRSVLVKPTRAKNASAVVEIEAGSSAPRPAYGRGACHGISIGTTRR